MRKKHRDRASPKAPIASPRARATKPPDPAHDSSQDFPIEYITADSSEAEETRSTPGGLASARIQGTRKGSALEVR